ncbi:MULTISPECIES: hypothetical protein [unclassified Micromonospora]|uniref:hypothetical protein n=1 Tax=unclassified Micromonospora TaxID=2617518 RepID=UPI003A87F20A
MLIDCDTCAVERGPSCRGCLVSALIDSPDAVTNLDAGERYAIEVFARAGFDVEVLGGSTAAPRGRRQRRPRSRRQVA